jgi:hypothetical protein
MTYDQLVDFVQNRMRMSHVYQPVMLAALLAHGGKCSTTEIARAILAHDESQVEYYASITKNIVKRVQSRHGIVEEGEGCLERIGEDNPKEEEIFRDLWEDETQREVVMEVLKADCEVRTGRPPDL